jgi:hypothetical protein
MLPIVIEKRAEAAGMLFGRKNNSSPARKYSLSLSGYPAVTAVARDS